MSVSISPYLCDSKSVSRTISSVLIPCCLRANVRVRDSRFMVLKCISLVQFPYRMAYRFQPQHFGRHATLLWAVLSSLECLIHNPCLLPVDTITPPHPSHDRKSHPQMLLNNSYKDNKGIFFPVWEYCQGFKHLLPLFHLMVYIGKVYICQTPSIT